MTDVADTKRGLYGKYRVTKADTGDEVHDCIVLRPDRDIAAHAALGTYASLIAEEQPTFAAELQTWLFGLTPWRQDDSNA